MKNFIKKIIGANLQLFAEEGTEGTTNVNVENQGEQATTPVANNEPDKTTPTKVVYGKQTDNVLNESEENHENNDNEGNDNPDIEGSNENNSEDYKKEWEKIKNNPKYRAEYDKEVQSIVKSRIKEHKQLEDKFNQQAEIIAVLSNKYGVTDIDELTKLVTKDIFEAEAYEKGIDPEYYAETQQLKLENERLKTKYKSEEEAKIMNQKVGKWFEEEKTVKETYPEFDLRQEAANNPQFLKLLESGITVLVAYELTNPDAREKRNKALVEAARKEVAEKIKARKDRPAEGAVISKSNNQGVIYKNDVHKLTKEDRKKINELVRRGEKISF